MKRKFLVKSESDKAKMYEVTLFTDTYSFVCECPDHQYRQRDCKHIKQVDSFLKGNKSTNVMEVTKK